ncbi:hypothetical protein EYF80_036954 [Liparis tanakae]|uniref:Uncharacterized protein n=1 Tax=Liparis tanakae TaxID=230148 RepID=A0A4Z2GJ83_9TELE|nr:hypothetical protein EYF80_036954 [Liparis tanakae]
MSLPKIFRTPGTDSWLDSSAGSSAAWRSPAGVAPPSVWLRRPLPGLRLNTAERRLCRRILLLAGCRMPALSVERTVRSELLDLRRQTPVENQNVVQRRKQQRRVRSEKRAAEESRSIVVPVRPAECPPVSLTRTEWGGDRLQLETRRAAAAVCGSDTATRLPWLVLVPLVAAERAETLTELPGSPGLLFCFCRHVFSPVRHAAALTARSDTRPQINRQVVDILVGQNQEYEDVT